MCFQRVLDHGQRPPLELRPGRMQPVVHRRHGQAEDRRDVLLGAVVHVEERHDLAQRRGQTGDGAQDDSNLLPLLEPVIRLRLLGGHRIGGGQGKSLEVPLPDHPVGLVTDDPPEPAGKCGGIGESNESEPRSDKGFLDDVFRRRVYADKPILRVLTPLLRPLFRWNHNWAIARAIEGLEPYARRSAGS